MNNLLIIINNIFNFFSGEMKQTHNEAPPGVPTVPFAAIMVVYSRGPEILDTVLPCACCIQSLWPTLLGPVPWNARITFLPRSPVTLSYTKMGSSRWTAKMGNPVFSNLALTSQIPEL